jgi:predicted ATPase
MSTVSVYNLLIQDRFAGRLADAIKTHSLATSDQIAIAEVCEEIRDFETIAAASFTCEALGINTDDIYNDVRREVRKIQNADRAAQPRRQ